METILIAVTVCLCVILLIFIIKYALLKKQIKSFTKQVGKRLDRDCNKTVSVDIFDGDITELAIALNRHTEIQRELGIEYENSRQRLNNVISGISHDFRTPLTASLGYLQLIEKSGELSDKYAEYLSVAIHKNRYLKELSDEFFELTRLESENAVIEYEPVNLSNVLTDTIMEQYGWAEQRGIKASFDIEEGIIIQSCPLYIQRIAENLFSNAEKYTRSLLGADLKREGERIILRVYNDIDEEHNIDTGRVFEPFYKTSSRSKSGSGLGLYVVKSFCDRLGYAAEAYYDEKGFFTIEIIF